MIIKGLKEYINEKNVNDYFKVELLFSDNIKFMLPLELAIFFNSKEEIESLIKLGANICLANDEGKTLIELAAEVEQNLDIFLKKCAIEHYIRINKLCSYFDVIIAIVDCKNPYEDAIKNIKVMGESFNDKLNLDEDL